jgi:hypothetical protein
MQATNKAVHEREIDMQLVNLASQDVASLQSYTHRLELSLKEVVQKRA